MYAELHAHSAYSFLDGASLPEELVAAAAGLGTPALVAIGLATGLGCGAVNGVLVTRLGLPSIVVTIGTMSLFRGIAYIILGDQAYTSYPADFAFFGAASVWLVD